MRTTKIMGWWWLGFGITQALASVYRLSWGGDFHQAFACIALGFVLLAIVEAWEKR